MVNDSWPVFDLWSFVAGDSEGSSCSRWGGWALGAFMCKPHPRRGTAGGSSCSRWRGGAGCSRASWVTASAARRWTSPASTPASAPTRTGSGRTQTTPTSASADGWERTRTVLTSTSANGRGRTQLARTSVSANGRERRRYLVPLKDYTIKEKDYNCFTEDVCWRRHDGNWIYLVFRSSLIHWFLLLKIFLEILKSVFVVYDVCLTFY